MKRIIFYLLLVVLASCKKENIPPTCEILTPSNGDEYNVGDIITISVEANDEDGVIEDVSFYIDNLFVASASSYPYTYNWDTDDVDGGIKEIMVSVIDDEGGVDVDEISISLNQIGEPPVAAFTSDKTTITQGNAIQFTDQSTNSPTGWEWTFGDGGTSTSQNPSHTYNHAGTYDVSLTVNNSAGSDTESKTSYITVSSVLLAPVAAFSSDLTTITPGNAIQFTDESANSPTSWEWTFGDGGTSTEQNPSYTYISAGSYQVTLTVTNTAGSDTESKPDYITVNENGGGTTGTVTDIQGNVYKTVAIGTQVWMAENLKTTKYNNDTDIPLVTEGTEWINLKTPGYCWYNNDEENYKETYGALYNWYTVNTDKLCPTGWHVPTDEEWTTLTTFLGGESVAGGKLKESGVTHWYPPNTGATNEAGFMALPGGGRGGGGSFSGTGGGGYWWSATESDTNYAWFRRVLYNTSEVGRSGYGKIFGFSVRCIKD